jgi:hypothetical protein
MIFGSLKSQAFIPGTHLKVGCMGSVFYWHSSYKEKIVTFLGVKPNSFGFTTCSLVTILIVLCRLPLLPLSLYIQRRRRYMKIYAVLNIVYREHLNIYFVFNKSLPKCVPYIR